MACDGSFLNLYLEILKLLWEPIIYLLGLGVYSFSWPQGSALRVHTVLYCIEGIRLCRWIRFTRETQTIKSKWTRRTYGSVFSNQTNLWGLSHWESTGLIIGPGLMINIDSTGIAQALNPDLRLRHLLSFVLLQDDSSITSVSKITRNPSAVLSI